MFKRHYVCVSVLGASQISGEIMETMDQFSICICTSAVFICERQRNHAHNTHRITREPSRYRCTLRSADPGTSLEFERNPSFGGL